MLEILLVKRNIDVLYLSEHWLSAVHTDFLSPQLQNYCLQCQNGSKKQRNTYTDKKLLHSNYLNKVQSLHCSRSYSVAVKINANSTIAYISVYRPPTSDVQFFFENIMSTLSAVTDSYQQCRIILAGDFNIDLSKNSRDKHNLHCIQYLK